MLAREKGREKAPPMGHGHTTALLPPYLHPVRIWGLCAQVAGSFSSCQAWALAAGHVGSSVLCRALSHWATGLPTSTLLDSGQRPLQVRLGKGVFR